MIAASCRPLVYQFPCGDLLAGCRPGVGPSKDHKRFNSPTSYWFCPATLASAAAKSAVKNAAVNSGLTAVAATSAACPGSGAVGTTLTRTLTAFHGHLSAASSTAVLNTSRLAL